MISAYARNAIVLGLLAAVGPFAIDMYLPALPTIAADLGASTAATQMTLTAFFIGFGGSQIVYGPLSDMTGRKPPLYVGLALFILGAIGSGLAPSIAWLIGFRLVQGIGAASVMVVPRAVIRDLHTGVHPADGDGHARPQRVADPRAACRQRAYRAVRLAGGVRRRDGRRPPRLPSHRLRAAGDLAQGAAG